MLNTRFGAVPVVDVKIPLPLAPSTVYKSSQNGNIVGPVIWVPGVPSGQSLVYAAGNVPVGVPNCRSPLLETLAFVYCPPKKVTGNGSVIAVSPSSTWLPVSSVPGTIDWPVDGVIEYVPQSVPFPLYVAPPIAAHCDCDKTWQD